MCGRVIQRSPPDLLGLRIVDGLEDRDNRWSNVPPHYNGAPAQDLWIIRKNPATGERSLDLLRWGLIPHFCTDKPKPPPINAAAETLATKTFPPETRPFFADAYAKRRCIMPMTASSVEGGEGRKDPATLRHRDEGRRALRPRRAVGELEGPGLGRLAAHLLHRHDPGERARAPDPQPHAGHPRASGYERWLAGEDDPRELMRPYPAEPMTMWPVSTRVNSYKNDDESLIAPALEADATAPPDGNSA